MKKIWDKIISSSALILLALLVITLIYIYKFSGFDLSLIKLFSAANLIVISLISIFLLLQNAIASRLLFSIFGLRLSFSEAFSISQFYGLLNYLPFKAGIIGQASYLKLNHNFPINRYIFSVIIVYLLNFLSYLSIGAYLLFFYDFSHLYANFNRINILVAFCILFFVIIFFVLKPRIKNIQSHFRHLDEFIENRKFILSAKTGLFYLFLLSLLSLLFTTLRIHILFGILVYSVPFHYSLMLAILSSFSFLISITPGGIGIKESFMGALTYILLDNVGIGVSIALITRIFDMFWVSLFGSAAFVKISAKHFYQQEQKDISNV